MKTPLRTRAYPLLIAAMLAFTTFANAQQTYPDWVRTKNAGSPDAAIIAAFADEIARIGPEPEGFPKDQILAVIKDGWKGDETLGAQLAAFDKNMEGLRKVVASGPIRLPEVRNSKDTVPHFGTLMMVFRSSSADAVRRAATGDINGAVDRCEFVARLLPTLMSEGQPLLSHLIVMAGSNALSGAIAQVSAAPGFTADHARRLGTALFAIESKMADASRLALADLTFTREFTEADMNDPSLKFGRSGYTAAHAAEFVRGMKLVAEAAAKELAKPYLQRTKLTQEDSAAVLRDPSLNPPMDSELIGEVLQKSANLTEANIRNEVALARLRMACLRCAQIAAIAPPATWVDPFTGKPFGKNAAGRYISASPDGVLGDGSQIYDPKNGIASPGDLVE